jgi:hypothetical protein
MATAGLKVCCACGADVNGQPRMKDSKGRYWCLPCGEADQRKKQITSTHAPCAGCHKSFPKGKLDPHNGAFFCKTCLKKAKAAHPTTDSTGTGTWHMGPGIAAAATAADRPVASAARASSPAAPTTDRKRLVIMASVLVALVLFALFYNFVLLAD